MSSLGSRDDGSIGNEREMDTRVRHQVGLELVQINVERTVEAERCGNGGDDCFHTHTKKKGQPMLS